MVIITEHRELHVFRYIFGQYACGGSRIQNQDIPSSIIPAANRAILSFYRNCGSAPKNTDIRRDPALPALKPGFRKTDGFLLDNQYHAGWSFPRPESGPPVP